MTSHNEKPGLEDHANDLREKAAAYAISAGLVGFGVWIAIAGLSSSAPAIWICAALIPIAVGLVSAFGPT
jgi:hypothetical protein